MARSRPAPNSQFFRLRTKAWEGFVTFLLYYDDTSVIMHTSLGGKAVSESCMLNPVGKDGVPLMLFGKDSEPLKYPKPEERFRWTPGKHVVRFAFSTSPPLPLEKAEPVLAFSNPVEVHIEGKPSGEVRHAQRPKPNALALYRHLRGWRSRRSTARRRRRGGGAEPISNRPAAGAFGKARFQLAHQHDF